MGKTVYEIPILRIGISYTVDPASKDLSNQRTLFRKPFGPNTLNYPSVERTPALKGHFYLDIEVSLKGRLPLYYN
jgi:hypothetical protein